MADLKTSDLPEKITFDDDDLVQITDSVDSLSKKIKLKTLEDNFLLSTEKLTFDGDDLLRMTDDGDGFIKSVSMATLRDISLLTEKTSLVSGDLFHITDDADGFAKKVKFSTLRQFVTRDIFFPVTPDNDDGDYRVKTIGASGSENFAFQIPDDFGQLVALELIGWPQTVGGSGSGKNIDLSSEYSNVGDLKDDNAETDSASFTLGNDAEEKFAIDISSVFGNLNAGQSCGVNVNHLAVGGSIAYAAIRLSYTVST